MFEEREWGYLDPGSGEPLPRGDGPELTEQDYLAEVERLIAADPQTLDPQTLDPQTLDPQTRPELSVAEVIARGESEPVTPGLIGALWSLDPASLDEDLAVGYVVAMDRVANAAHARRGLGVARVAAVSPDTVLAREQHAAGQLAAALGVGLGAAAELVTDAVTLDMMLPATQGLALTGELTWRKASAVASAVAGLSPEHCAAVEELVLPKARGRAVGAHDAAVRKAVDRVDPDGVENRKAEQQRDIRMVRHHYGAGMAQIFLDLPAEDADRIWLAADTWARRRKADGDPRTLRRLRVACWLSWADSFLTHADPYTCDRDNHHAPIDVADSDGQDSDAEDTDAEDSDADADATAAPVESGPVGSGPPESGPSLPRRHGRSVVQTVVWDLTSLLGLTRHGGLLLDTDTVIAASTVRELIAGGVRVRRAVIDTLGHLSDLTPTAWFLPPADGSSHRAPVELLLTTTARLEDLPLVQQWALQDLDDTDPRLARLLRELLDYPLTADELDAHPADEQPSAALAAYICLRAGHPINPSAGPTAANAADIEHHIARSQGGETTRINLGPVIRRWHRIKTFDNWTIKQTPQGWQWTSPTGRTYLIEPFDYRLGP